MKLDLEGQVVLITGAAGGIGFGIAQECASRGAEVLAVDRVAPQFEDMNESIRSRMHAYVADLSTSPGCRALLDEVTRDFPKVDGVVNCAGIMRRGAITELSEDDWDVTFGVNIDAVFRICKSFVPLMERSGGGSIVNIASQWGVHPAAGHIAYNASKAAVVSFTRSLARDYGSVNIRANAVCPGEILTPMVEAKLTSSGMTEEQLSADIPIGRLGRPADVAHLVAFLLGGDSTFISGATIEITGGQVAP